MYFAFFISKWKVGVELDEPMGKNNGKTPCGKQIFVCEKGEKYGMFVRPDNVEVWAKHYQIYIIFISTAMFWSENEIWMFPILPRLVIFQSETLLTSYQTMKSDARFINFNKTFTKFWQKVYYFMIFMQS